tara:strand:- start:3571 stop:3822 length:252 start_codon:yes stop_codon:yes gene_type:complete
MKHYLITVTIYDGDHEYWDKAIIQTDDIENEHKLLKAWSGHEDLQYDEDYRAYMSPYTYRGYRLYSSQEIDENDLPTLRKYHI